MAAQARLMSKAMRKLNGIVSTTGTLLIFINQYRSKLMTFGNPETTTGGNALKFYASIRIDIRKIATLKGKDDKLAMGSRTKMKVIKSKVSPPFKEIEVDILYGEGISPYNEVFELAVLKGILVQTFLLSLN